MFRTVFKICLYGFIIFILVFGLSLFGEKIGHWGKEAVQVTKRVVGAKPIAAVEKFFSETAPRYARKIRRKMLTHREDLPEKKPDLLGYKDKKAPQLKAKPKAQSGGHPQETLTVREREELEELIEEDRP